MRAIVFHFIASHPVAETMKRSAIRRLEQPQLQPIRSNTPNLVVRLSTNFGWDNAADASQETAGSQPQKSSYNFYTSSEEHRLPPKRSISSYPRHSRAESFAQQIQLSMRNAAMKS